MSKFTETRDAFLRSVGLKDNPAISAASVGQTAGNGVINLATNAFSNLFRDSSGVAATGTQPAPISAAKVSVPLVIGGIAVAYLLLRRK